MEYDDIHWLYFACLTSKRRYKMLKGELYYYYPSRSLHCLPSYCIKADRIGKYIIERE